ncbi:MAG: MFS transporter [Syntrophomonadaceae bacterium]|nr:MFS transporter [Syntrophomonadaceae bacterium]
MGIRSKGGFYGWAMVALLFVVYFITGGFGQYGVAVVNGLMCKELGISRASLGLGMSAFALFQGFAAPLIAKSINSKGIKFTIALGSFGFAIIALIMATVVHTVAAYTVVFGVLGGGLLATASTVPAQASLNLWFKKRRALAIAIVMLSAGLGGFVISPMVVKVVNATTHSYTAGWYLIMIGFALAGILTLIFGVNKPQDLGQVPDGAYVEKEEKKKESRVYKVKKAIDIKVILRHPSMWWMTLASSCFFFCFSMINTHAVIHLSESGGLSLAQAALAYGIMPFLSIGGRVVIGLVGDIVEPRHLWSGAIICYVIGIYFLMTSSTYATAIAFAAFVGIGWGANMVCFPAVIGNYYGGESYSSVMAYMFPIKQIANAISPVMAGAIYDATGSYSIAFMIGIGVCVISFIGLQFVRPIKTDDNTAIAA